MTSMISRLGAAICLVLLPCAASAKTAWVRAESPNLVVYSDMDPAATQRFVENLETFDQFLRLRHRVAADDTVRRKLPIYLLRRSGDMQKIRPGIDRGIRGFWTSNLEDTYAVATGDSEDDTLLHEYVHHFMLDRYPFGYPGWLVEGYAEYFMTYRRTASYLEVGNVNENRGTWLSRGRWIPFTTLLSASPGSLKTDGERAMFYAQAWGLTHWFMSDPERGRQLDAYLAAVGRGEPSVKAMTAATGLSPVKLEKTVQAYLSKGFHYQRMAASVVKAPPVTLTPLSAAASDVLLPTLRLRNDNGIDAPKDRTDGPVLLAAVRKAAEPHQGDRLADLALAAAEVKLGDPAKAEGLLQARLAADAKDVEALHLLAVARLKAAETADEAAARKLKAEARTLAGRAFKLDPNHYPTLVAYAQAREGERNYPTENDVNVLLDALDLAPQVGALRIKAATALAGRKRIDDAVNVLRPLAFNPHGGSAAVSARLLMAMFEAMGEPASAGATAGAKSP